MIPLFLISVLLPGGIVAEEPPPVAKAALRSVNFLQDPNQKPPGPPIRIPPAADQARNTAEFRGNREV
ncbi:MAG: hypothetical protein ACR2I2_12940 [Bryobacteraceae bacterium]